MATREDVPSPAIPSASEQIRRLIERLVFEAHRAAKGPGPDTVHDLRVAIRRAEQALTAFKPLLPRKAVKRIRKQLKAVLSCAGVVRDSDIAAKILQKIDQPGSRELRREIRARRKTAERSLLMRLKRLSLRTRASQWFMELGLHALPAQPWEEARKTAAKLLNRLARRFFEAGNSASSHDSGEKLHEFRIQAKKFRYQMELFAPLYGSATEEWIQKIKSVQSVLGKMNDYRSVLAMAVEARCGKKLKSSLKRSERRQVREFRQIWAERFSGSVGAEWKRVLKGDRPERRIPHKPVATMGAPPPAAAAQA